MTDLIVKLGGTGTISVATSGVACVDIPQEGFIVGILGHVRGSGMATGDSAEAEVSFLSTHQFLVNDARGSLMEMATKTGDITTSGQAQASQTTFMSFLDGIPVAAGERLHLHTQGSTGVTPTGLFMLYILLGSIRRRSQRRR